jgi:outer membrane lipoprotein-sorting protein
MKNIKLLVTVLFSSFALISLAQQDPQAKKILDDFSKKTKSYKSFKADFTITADNRQNNEKTDNKGSIIMKGDKYRMKINDNEIFYDGKDIYNYSSESNEVSISKQDNSKSDETLLNDPSKLFHLYTKNYKYRYLGETKVGDANCYEIDLYPSDLKKKYSIVKMIISQDKLELKTVKLIMKSGLNYILTIDSFNNNAEAKDSDFIFNTKAHAGVEVVDLR